MKKKTRKFHYEKRKPLKRGQTRNNQNKIVTYTGEKLRAIRKEHRYAKSRRLTKENYRKIDLESTFKSFEGYRNKRGAKKRYIFRVMINHNIKGKQIKAAFSLKRTAIKNFKDYKEKFLTEFKKKLKKYLARKDYISTTITGYSSEVVERAHKPKTTKRRKRKKK